MSPESNNDEQTQPIKVHPDVEISEDTSRMNLAQQKPVLAEEIPEWLLEFASQPTSEASGESQHGLEAIEEPAPEPLEAVTPIVLETAEWHVVQAELENPTPALDEEVSTISSDQIIRDYLGMGNYAAAADFIRKAATTKEFAAESQRALRSHLVFQVDRTELWNVYDELSEIIKQDDKQTESTEDEWKDR
jgi:hypothetical protein